MFRSIIANLPKKIQVQLTRTECMILELMVEMGVKKKEDKKLDMKTMYMTEYWLAERLGKSRVWISRSICKLEKLGLLKVMRRRREDGKWSVNLYRIGYIILRVLGLWRQATREILHRVKSSLQEVAYSRKEKEKRKKRNQLIGIAVGNLYQPVSELVQKEREKQKKTFEEWKKGHSDLFSLMERIGKIIEERS